MTHTAYKFKTLEDLEIVQSLHPDGYFWLGSMNDFLSAAIHEYDEDDLVIYYNPESYFTYGSGEDYRMYNAGEEPLELTNNVQPQFAESNATMQVTNDVPFTESEATMKVISEHFERLGITVAKMAEIVYRDQKPYIDTLTEREASWAVSRVLNKTEFQDGLLVAIHLDKVAQMFNLMKEDNPLMNRLIVDHPNFGADEHLAMSLAGLYGSIATTNYGYIDKTKPGIVGELNEMGKSGEYVTTMMDDMIGVIIASAEAKLAKGE